MSFITKTSGVNVIKIRVCINLVYLAHEITQWAVKSIQFLLTPFPSITEDEEREAFAD